MEFKADFRCRIDFRHKERKGPRIHMPDTRAPRLEKAFLTHEAQPGTEKARTSLSSPPTPPKWRSAFSTKTARRSWSGSNCPSTPTRSGMAICPMCARARSTAIGSTALTSRKPGTASIPTSCCSIPTRWRIIGELKWDPAVFGYKMESGDDTTFDERDSAPFMPKCVVVDPNFDWHGQAC